MIVEELIELIMEQFEAMNGMTYFDRIRERTKLKYDKRYLAIWANNILGKESI